MEPSTWLLLALLAVALLPLLGRALRTRSRGRIAALLAGLAAGAALLAAAEHAARAPFDPEAGVADRPIAVRADGYVSSDACQACHPREYATWHGSFHRRMAQVATPETVLAPFDGVELELDGRSYRLSRRGDEFWVEMDAPGGGNGHPERVERRVVMTTGSHHFQAYWLTTGEARKVGLFQFCYDIAEARWMPMDALPVVHPGVRQASLQGFGRWNTDCSSCHSTGPSPRVSGPDAMDTHVAELGIACEACHGPAERHVSQLAHAPWRRYQAHWSDEAQDTIVDPRRLSHRRSAEICGQCHSVHISASPAEERLRLGEGPSYRPGDKLSDTRRVLHGERDSGLGAATRFWPDGFVRVNGREYNSLLRTPCFLRGELTCVSCHQMHQQGDDPRSRAEWADDQLAAEMRGNQACVQCHARFGDEAVLVGHTHHAPGSPGSQCYNCHMPNTAYGLHKATRNHEIDSPALAPSVAAGRPNACNLCHLDRSLGWTARNLEAWYGIPAPTLNRDQQEIAASVLWSLSGDAAQRAVIAWHMGWAPAQQASGTDWMAPYLAQGLADPYAAVRSVAYRSLRGLPGFEDFEYDFVAAREEQREAKRLALRTWQESEREQPRSDGDALLIDAHGALDRPTFNRLLRERDQRFIYLAE